MDELSHQQVNEIIELALAEDIDYGDVTSWALISPRKRGKASIIAQEGGVLAGIDITALVFHKVESQLEIDIHKNDGEKVKTGDRVLTIDGDAAAILKAERVALNFLNHLSGIASETVKYATAIRETKAVIMDTRKTMPGMRLLEKYAVRMGGGQNHRLHLGDGILIKDNHLAVLWQQKISLADVVARAKQKAPAGIRVEVEVDNPQQALEAAAAGADIVMLDNMSPEDMRKAVKLVAGRAKLEASGGINLDNVLEVALSGVDYISIGAITHSAKAMDFSLRFET
jgi:nicotinate-nucleotide pyrophosphorylase (carboxylating)